MCYPVKIFIEHKTNITQKQAKSKLNDAAETIHNSLSAFFKSHGRRSAEEPTEKQELRDFKALQHGKHDGILVIENRNPKLSGGKHKVIDESYKDTDKFKSSIEGDIKE